MARPFLPFLEVSQDHADMNGKHLGFYNVIGRENGTQFQAHTPG